MQESQSRSSADCGVEGLLRQHRQRLVKLHHAELQKSLCSASRAMRAHWQSLQGSPQQWHTWSWNPCNPLTNFFSISFLKPLESTVRSLSYTHPSLDKVFFLISTYLLEKSELFQYSESILSSSGKGAGTKSLLNGRQLKTETGQNFRWGFVFNEL